MHWPRDLQGWPHAELSRRIAGPVHRWHVQSTDADKPDLLLLHGAGGSTHSWRHVIEPLSQNWRVIAPDLPGHGFTTLGQTNRSGIQPMGEDLVALGQTEGWQPAAIMGHSAGAALALQLTQSGPWRGVPVFGINAALGPFTGLAGVMFPIMAQMMAALPFVPGLVARQVGQDQQITKLIESTGSTLDAAGRELYRRLAADRDHIAGTLKMMAQWELEPLLDTLPNHPSQVTLMAGKDDKTVPYDISVKAADQIPRCISLVASGLGHLAQEESPEQVVRQFESAIHRPNSS